MAHFLYVCSFSNGAVKVGRSSDPDSRIAQHEERVSCLGILLNEKHTIECVGPVVPAETEMIQRCAGAATTRHKNEWFYGLDFTEVCEWAGEIATGVFATPAPRSSFGQRLMLARRERGLTQAQLGQGMGTSGSDIQKASVSSWERGTSSPNVDQLRRLCERLHVSADSLVFDQQPIPA